MPLAELKVALTDKKIQLVSSLHQTTKKNLKLKNIQKNNV